MNPYSIRFFADFTQRRGKKDEMNGILIVTDSMLLYVEDFKNLSFDCRINTISKCEVYEERLRTKTI